MALQKEFNTLECKGTFKKVNVLEAKGEPIILTIVVFIYKFDEEGYLLRYKARIIVRGDLQPKLSYEDNYVATLAARAF